MKIIKQYEDKLTLTQIADGMNHCRNNARRLLRSAKALCGVKDYATAVSLAILAIEESGKIALLRRMVTAENDEEWRRSWKDFRSHCQKNGFADIVTMLKPVMRLDEGRHLTEKSDKNSKVDELKQIGFYVDCVGKGEWLCPKETITEEIAVKVLSIAGVICRSDKHTTVRELELWKETVGSCSDGTLSEMKERLIIWRHRMEEEGLEQMDPGFEKFVMDGVNIHNMTGHEVSDCILEVMRNELSVDYVWRTVFKKIANA